MILLVAAFIGLALSLTLGPITIPWFHRIRFGQTIRDVGPSSHLKKQGTPTMGGVIFLVPLVVSVAVLLSHSTTAWSLVLLIVGYGLIGFSDDMLKVAFKRPLGLKAREKLLLQLILAVGFVWFMQMHAGTDHRWILPFGLPVWSPGMFYGPLAVLAILGSSNAVNITDGLDGLAGGASFIVMGFFSLLAIHQHDPALGVVAMTLMGGLVGFLRFNLHPAKIFMGDTGSLALGAAVAGAAVLTHTVLVLPVVGVLFVIETGSVILQVLSFRLTGRRIFRMSPLHHHFELGGWTEERVVSVFWFVALMGAVAAWWV